MIFRRGVIIAVALMLTAVALMLAAAASAPAQLLEGEKAHEGWQRPRSSQPGSRPDVASLRFLIGDWEAIGTPAGETGGFTFSLGVQNRVMTRTNYATYDARNGRTASRHDDLMVIYEEGGQLKADYFDSERHVIRYLVEPRGDHDVMFVSDAKPSDPRYRLRYTARNDGTLAGRFEIAAPGTPDAFTPYLSWTARKRP